MKRKSLGIIILTLFTIPAVAQNLIGNPGFDEVPWDTGWVITTEGITSAESDTEIYHSASQSCKLYARENHLTSRANIAISQQIFPVVNCTCRVYCQDFAGQDQYTASAVGISVKVNGTWVDEWSAGGRNSIWVKWEKTYGYNDTVSGIKFWCGACVSMSGAIAEGEFWIDDVYIGGEKIGIEEKPKEEIAGFNVYPNPFRSQTVVCRLSQKNKPFDIGIYDISGKVIRKLRGPTVWDGRDRNGKKAVSGIYYVKLEGVNKEYKFVKKIVKLY
ncbi:MAG: T9SS type A sorting domain-containing protein [bacterium]|nr:T9SS type A sorting domain-containing protein [bacterium]